MKRFLLISLVLGLFAGQASAAMYEMDRNTAALLYDVSWSDVQAYEMRYVGYKPGGVLDKIYGTQPVYGASMEYAVGFAGNMTVAQTGGNSLASVNIGLGPSGQYNTLSGTYDGFVLAISNDDQQIWEYKLYVDPIGAAYYESPSWTSFAGFAEAKLTLPFGTNVVFTNNLTDIGFKIQFNVATTGGGSVYSDDFHTSVVPVPAAVLLGVLGLGIAGLKLRRFA